MKITKFFALMCAAAAFALAGCESIEGTPDDGDNNGGNNNGGNNNGGGNTTSDLVLSAEETTIALGEDIVLNVTEGGVDVTSASDCVIYDYKTMEPVTGNTLTPDSTGVYSFFATKGSKSSTRRPCDRRHPRYARRQKAGSRAWRGPDPRHPRQRQLYQGRRR